MISRDLFINSIYAIEKQFKHDKKCSEALSILFDDGVGFYNYSPVLSALENILKEEMSDNHKDSWIDYFIYELDFGEKWTEKSISEKDGSIIYMRNADELYDYLTENKYCEHRFRTLWNGHKNNYVCVKCGYKKNSIFDK